MAAAPGQLLGEGGFDLAARQPTLGPAALTIHQGKQLRIQQLIELLHHQLSPTYRARAKPLMHQGSGEGEQGHDRSLSGLNTSSEACLPPPEQASRLKPHCGDDGTTFAAGGIATRLGLWQHRSLLLARHTGRDRCPMDRQGRSHKPPI